MYVCYISAFSRLAWEEAADLFAGRLYVCPHFVEPGAVDR